jgi:hypothetical protein
VDVEVGDVSTWPVNRMYAEYLFLRGEFFVLETPFTGTLPTTD